MKKINPFLLTVTIVLSAFVITNSSSAQSQEWSLVGPTQVAPSGPVTFVIGTKAYVGMGYDCVDDYDNYDLSEFNPLTNSWTYKANFPDHNGLANAVAFSINGKAYVVSGANFNGSANRVWVYDPSTDTWTQKNNFPGIDRSYAVAFSIGNKGYITTGSSNSENTPLSDLWEYDPSADSWTQKNDFPGGPRAGAISFTIGNTAYIGTGQNSNVLADLWAYNAANDTWAQKSSMPVTAGLPTPGRTSAAAFSLNNKGYVGTGQYYYSTKETSYYYTYPDFWSYDPLTDSWQQIPDFAGEIRAGAFTFSVSGKGYVGGGNHCNTNSCGCSADMYQLNEEIKSVFYADIDSDGYGNINHDTLAVAQPNGFVADSTDCNDANANINPGATEICDGLDNNCNGQIDETCIPGVSINDRGITEGNSGTQTMKFTVSLNHPYTAGTVRVKIATADSTAANGSDYTGGSGTLKFLPGQTSKQIPITINGDTQPEPNEKFKVIISNPVNATISDGLGIGTIRNDDVISNSVQEADAITLTNTAVTAKPFAKVWPNPAANVLNVQLTTPTANIASVQLISIGGNVLQEWKFSASAKLNTQQLNTTGIANGVYVLMIKDSKDNTQTERIIISR